MNRAIVGVPCHSSGLARSVTWLRFPGFALEPLEQRYTRTAADGYRYESGGGAFVRDLAVNADGFVTRYPGFFEAEG